MRLSSLVPSISGKLVEYLEGINIRTDSDVLFSLSLVEIFKKLPKGSATIAELEAAREIILERCSTVGQCLSTAGSDLNEVCVQKPLTGFEPLDTLLDGLFEDTIVQVSGDRGSGKSVRYWILDIEPDFN